MKGIVNLSFGMEVSVSSNVLNWMRIWKGCTQFE